MASSDIQEAIRLLTERRSLSEEQAEAAMAAIMRGEATPAQVAGFAIALRMKGETAEEVAGMARAMRRHAVRVEPPPGRKVVDTCGTGGDRSHSINVSTGAAFVAAGAGLAVAKHGNRSVSSQTGSADVLEAMGVSVDLTPEQVRRCLEEVGMAFLFAPTFHPAMRHAAQPRRELGVRTVFNILGPLTNPAGAPFQLVGVYEPALVDLVAGALARLGTERALVVHGLDGIDEISLSGPTLAAWVEGGEVRRFTIDPTGLGLEPAPLEAIRGDGPATNARLLREVLSGERHGPLRDVVLLNAAGCLWAAGAAGSLAEGLELARHSVDSGAAYQRLEAMTRFCRRRADTAAPSVP
ncbi:MAG TPA: anthranilate phosphoribosyltransferase [Limnochordales bacterium]